MEFSITNFIWPPSAHRFTHLACFGHPSCMFWRSSWHWSILFPLGWSSADSACAYIPFICLGLQL